MAEAHPVGFRWVMKAKERGATHHPRRPALQPHQRARRPARADPGRHRHRLPRRADPPHDRDRAYFDEYVAPLHQRRDAGRRGLPRHRGPRRLSSAASTPRPAPTTARAGCTRAARSRRRPASASTPTQAFDDADGRRHARGRARARRDAAAPALRLPGAQAPLRPLHAGDGRARLRASRARTSSRVAETLIGQLGPRAHDGAGSTRSAGRSTPPACRSSAPRAILQLLLGNIGPPRRRHHGDARARLDPGLDRHPDAVRPAAGLPAHAAGPRGRLHARSLRRLGTAPTAAGGRTSTATSSAC